MAGPFRWDPAINRYRDSRGRLVAASWVRRELDAALDVRAKAAARLVEDLRAGRISLLDWRREMRQMIKDVHLYSAAAARGGWSAMSPAAYGQVGRRIRDEYGFLEGLVQDIAKGIPVDGRIAARARQYAHAGRDTFHVAERSVMRQGGMTEERNVLHPAEHCTGAGSCVEQSDKGWVPLGTLLPIGRRKCRRNCRCTLEYRTTAKRQRSAA